MTDLSSTISPKSDQLNSDDLISGPRTVTITKVSQWNSEQPIAIHFEGDNGKPYLPCKSMRRVLVHVWGSDGAAYAGRSMTLYRDPEVMFGGLKVGGIRISHMTNMEADMVMSLTASKKARAPFRVRMLVLSKSAPRSAAPPAADAFTQDEARTAARRGTEAFKAWWAANPDKRTDAKPIMEELKVLCSAADTAINADPFGLPPLSDPTPAQIAAAEAEALRAAEQAAREADSQ